MDLARVYHGRLQKVSEKRQKISNLHDPEQLIVLEKAIDEQQSQIRAFFEEVKITQRLYDEEKTRYAKLQEDKTTLFKVRQRKDVIRELFINAMTVLALGRSQKAI
jgi:flagellar biosynthesis chaperone FliJ